MWLVRRRDVMLGFGACAAALADATAGQPALPEPTGRVILSISGRIGVTNAGDEAQFDRSMLEDLGLASFTTVTPWYNGPVTFEGVPMVRLMQRVGAAGSTVQAIALNDYSTEIPMADFATWGVLLALKRDGKYLEVRDKGPLFIVYPYDTSSELRAPRYYGRSAWQVAKLLVR
jgi:hypothetical protein